MKNTWFFWSVILIKMTFFITCHIINLSKGSNKKKFHQVPKSSQIGHIERQPHDV